MTRLLGGGESGNSGGKGASVGWGGGRRCAASYLAPLQGAGPGTVPFIGDVPGY